MTCRRRTTGAIELELAPLLGIGTGSGEDGGGAGGAVTDDFGGTGIDDVATEDEEEDRGVDDGEDKGAGEDEWTIDEECAGIEEEGWSQHEGRGIVGRGDGNDEGGAEVK